MIASARVVTCDLAFDVIEPATIALQIAAAGDGISDERLDLHVDGAGLPPASELATVHGGRIHLLNAPRGLVSISYRARVGPSGHVPDAGPPGLDQLTYLRPSRYCPSDHVVGFAVAEFGALPPGRPRADAVASWVNQRVGYVIGSSDVHDSAEDTMLTGQGVCRDFAHLGVVLCRALEVPARFAAVYAPGLSPMDFHAVFEARVDGEWLAYDATQQAPRHSLVRIATGRDAADTAFASVMGGIAMLRSVEVTAVVDGTLPVDDHTDGVSLS